MKKVLVRLPNWLGDITFALPAIQGLHDKGYRIDVVIPGKFFGIEKSFPIISEAISVNDPDLISKVRNRSYDILIILPNSFSSAFKMFKTKIPVRIGYKNEFRSIFLTKSIKRPAKHSVHIEDYYLELFKLIEPDLKPSKIVSKDHEISNDLVVKMLKKRNKPVVGIGPGAAFGDAKRWNLEKYAELADRLNDFSKPILIGGKEDLLIEPDIFHHAKIKPESLIGKSSIEELVYILKKLDLFITNDTGPAHLARALGTKTITIFSSTDPVEVMQKDSVVIRSDVECSPCYKRTCPLERHHCMENVQVDEVFDKAKEILTQ